MNRRRFLRLAGVGVGTGVGGCLSADRFAGSIVGDSATAGEWSTFGFDRANTGHAPNASGPTGDAEVVWEFEAGGRAAASPVVVGDTVYAANSGEDGSLYALDAATGGKRWAFDTDGGVNHAPAVADGTVYVGTAGQRFHAVDAATGAERWRTDLGHDLHVSSPTVADGRVYVGTAGDSPDVATDASEVDRSAALFALDAETGGVRWSFEVPDWVSATPAVVDDRVYFCVADGGVRALDAVTGEPVWSFDLDRRAFSSPTVSNGAVYVGATGTLFALDAETGDPNWSFDLAWPTVKSSPAIADGTVYVACYGDGSCPRGVDDDPCDPPDHTAKLYALDADYGAEKWSYDIAYDARSSPAVADGAVYLGCADGVSAVDARDGSEVWRVELGEYVDSSPAIADGRVFVGCSDGRVYALGE